MNDALRRFALGMQLIEGNNDVLEIAQEYARLAETTLSTLVTATVTEFEQAHGKIAGGELIIVALGSLGGEEMTHESDLDIVPLFTGNPLAESDGPQSLVATQYFNQLGKQVITALDAVYETVIGFQPWDAKDRFCTSVEDFDQYYRETACVAVAAQYGRARVVFGSTDARIHVDTVIHDILLAQRNAENLRYHVAVRREDMVVQRNAAEGVLDVKLLSGGLMDMIFIIHTLQLETQVGIKPQLTLAIDDLIAAGHLTSDFADAYTMMMRLKMLVCILAPDYAVPSEKDQQLIANRLEFDDWDGLMQSLIHHRGVVIDQWQNMFDPALLRRHQTKNK
jgi:glutamate-ammonia-ligase adenylyltransferase